MQSDKPSTNTGRLIYNGIYDCLIKIIRNEGASALFKGVRRTGSNLHTASAALALVFFSELTVAESS
jgi:Mitochondrial carrier protein.